jgi:hypothetical protein
MDMRISLANLADEDYVGNRPADHALLDRFYAEYRGSTWNA